MKKTIAIVTVLALMLITIPAFAQSEPKIETFKVMTMEDGNDIIQIKHGSYNGVEFIDMRECFKNENGELVFTKRGFAIKPENLKELIRNLGQLL